MFRMEQTKTGKARFWKLDPDVHSALMLRWHQEGEPGPLRFVFRASEGRRFTRQAVWHFFRKHLTAAGVTREELHTETNKRRPLRVHDLRASFVTWRWPPASPSSG